ncbi:hypothetical protein V7S43_000001 [Phytophthora oleae]|uniref:DUF659 domain-containing protein n=1 Tax=Phytophthora oleae TaxID=2107226 RepID=A0ABD3G8B0_9STRA
MADTASAARKVSKQFDTTLQTDCAMHTLNLCIGYGIGLKENVRNMYVPDPKANEINEYIKKKVAMTKGGSFPEGGVIIRKLRLLNNFFASSRSPERIAKRKEVQKFYKLPQLSAIVDIDRAELTNAEKAVFTNISNAEWELVVQLEAVVQQITDLALVESQSTTMLSSTMYVLLRVAATRMSPYKFTATSLHGTRNADTNEKNFSRCQLTLPDLCDLAERCNK